MDEFGKFLQSKKVNLIKGNTGPGAVFIPGSPH